LREEPAEYLARREELRLAEIELMRQRERVAELRRQLPAGAIVEDYEFEDVSTGESVRLSELFTAPDRPLVLYHLMYGKKQTKPCPMCTMWIDGWNGVAHHIAQNADLAIVAAAGVPELRAYARERGWNHLRLLSCGLNRFKFDMRSEDEEGRQDSTVSVFTKESDGRLRHFYTAHPAMGDDIRERGVDLLTPVYSILDLTPRGRGSWYASLDYGVSRTQ
jgi:predicted dithiol-disulfide oxidoreductase (DUF899 family)